MGALTRKRQYFMSLQKKGRLPAGFIELEYIVCGRKGSTSSTTYNSPIVPIGIKANQNTVIEIDVDKEINFSFNRHLSVFGSKTADEENTSTVRLNMGDFRTAASLFGYTQTKPTDNTGGLTTGIVGRHKFSFSKYGCFLDTETTPLKSWIPINEPEYEDFETTNELTILGFYNNSNTFIGKFYGAKIYDEDVCVSELVPVIYQNVRLGLYDLKRNLFLEPYGYQPDRPLWEAGPPV